MLQTKPMLRIAVGLRQWPSLAVGFVMLAGASLSAAAQSGFEIGSVPRPEGAEVVADRASPNSATYAYPASVANTMSATDKSLSAGGWVRYRTPDQEPTRWSPGAAASAANAPDAPD